MTDLASIESAIAAIQQGEMIILVDDENREQEGDLVIAAEKITAAQINFMIKHARGLVCLTLTEEAVRRLHIARMPERHKLPNQAAFLTSIEAREGVTTGVSAEDRAHTIRTAVNPSATFHDISTPGHVFPLQARSGGVLERPGHTEGSVDLVRLAGLEPAAVICEIMKEDGTMARMTDLMSFAKQHQIKVVAINDLVAYRLRHETVVEEIAQAELPLKGNISPTIKVFRDRYQQTEHVALVFGELKRDQPPLVRIHSECLTGDVFGSLRCDCGEQLNHSLEQIKQHGGILLYMRQEGRGIGLANKIKSYQLQATGLDTVEANHQLGFQADHRSYSLCAQMLRVLGVEQIRLLTNNPHKLQDIEQSGIKVVERVSIETIPTKENIQYLQVKRDKLGHWLNLD